MPFTLSHPAAVIPLRRWGIFSALIIGSIMPDSVYFLPFMDEHDRFAHTLPGIVFYCLPAGIALLWIFHNIAKRPLIALFPEREQGRLLEASPVFHFGPPRRFALILWSLFLGILTHVLWDSFTHMDSYAFEHWPWFSQSIRVPNGPKIWMVEILQLFFSIAGLVFIAWCYARWKKHTQSSFTVPGPRVPMAARIGLFVVFALSAIEPLVERFVDDPQYWLHARRRNMVGLSVVDGIRIVCVELLLYCLVWQVIRARREQTSGRTGEEQTGEQPVSHSSSSLNPH